MTDPPKPVTEDEVHAYVDGGLPSDRTEAVKAHLRDDPEAASRVAAYKAQMTGLHAAFDPILEEPVPVPILDATHPRARRRIPLPIGLAAGIVLFLVGAGAGWFGGGMNGATPDNVRDFIRHAAAAHRIYVAERRFAVEVAAKEEKRMVRWLSKRLGGELKVPVLLDQGFELLGGRQLASPDNTAAAQFMYQDGKSRRLTLYVRPTLSDERTSFRFVREESALLFYWIDQPFAYALAGQIDKDELLKISRVVAEQVSP